MAPRHLKTVATTEEKHMKPQKRDDQTGSSSEAGVTSDNAPTAVSPVTILAATTGTFVHNYDEEEEKPVCVGQLTYVH